MNLELIVPNSTKLRTPRNDWQLTTDNSKQQLQQEPGEIEKNKKGSFWL